MNSATQQPSRIFKIVKNQKFWEKKSILYYVFEHKAKFPKTGIYVIEDLSISMCFKLYIDIFKNDRVMLFSRFNMATFHDNSMHSDEFWTF